MDYTVELACRAHDGDKEAFNELYDEYKKFISYMAGKMRKKIHGLDYDEMNAVRNESFALKIKKLDRDVLKNINKNELTLMIGNEIKWGLIRAKEKASYSLLKIPRKPMENYWNVKKFAKEYELKNGKFPSEEIIKKEINLNEKELEKVQLIAERNNYYEDIKEEEFRIADKKNEYEEFLNYELLNNLLDTLNDREKYIIKELFLNESTQNKIAKNLNISQPYVGKIRDKALEKMRDKYDEWIN